MLPDGHRQCFAGGIYAGDSALRANGALCEHRRLALELPLLVQIFQRTQQIIRGILLKQPPIFAVVQQAVLCGKGIVGGVQTLLRCLDVGIWVILQLLLNQVIDDLPQFHHAGDTPLGGVGKFHLRHHGVFPVEYLTVHHRVGEVFHIRVSRENMLLVFGIRNIWCFYLNFGVLPLNMLHRFCKLVCKICTLDGSNSQFLSSILGAFGGEYAQNHLRVVCEILVDGKAALGLAKLHPVRLMVNGAVTLLQKDNVADNIRAGIGAKRIIRQTDSTQQVSTLCHVLASGAVLAVHGVARCDKGNDTARTHLVDGLGEKIVVDAKAKFVVRLVVDLVLTKGHVAHSEVIKITAVGGFKSGNGNVSLRVQFFRNAPSDAVQLHAVQPTVLQGVRQHSEEVAHAHTRFQNVTAVETHALHGIVDTTDDGGAGIVGVQGAGTGSSVLILGKQSFQFGVFLCPIIFAGVKSVCQTAPAHILRKHLLLLGGGTPVLLFQLEQGSDGFNVPGVLLFCAALTQMIVRDVEVPGKFKCGSFRFNCIQSR